MKKLAIYSAMLVTLLMVTACDNRQTGQPTRDRTTPSGPNQPGQPGQYGQPGPYGGPDRGDQTQR